VKENCQKSIRKMLLKWTVCTSTSTERITDLDLRSKMIIFGLILTTFKFSIIFRGSWGSIENWLEHKT